MDLAGGGTSLRRAIAKCCRAAKITRMDEHFILEINNQEHGCHPLDPSNDQKFTRRFRHLVKQLAVGKNLTYKNVLNEILSF